MESRAVHTVLFDHADGLPTREVARLLELRPEEARAVLRQEEQAGLVRSRYDGVEGEIYRTLLRAPPPRGRVIFPAARQARHDVLHRVLGLYPDGLTEADVTFQLGCDRRTARRLLEEEIRAGFVQSRMDGDCRLFWSLVTLGRSLWGRPLWFWGAIAAGALAIIGAVFVLATAQAVPSQVDAPAAAPVSPEVRQELLSERRRLSTQHQRLLRAAKSCPTLWAQGQKCVVEGQILDKPAFDATLSHVEARLGQLDQTLGK